MGNTVSSNAAIDTNRELEWSRLDLGRLLDGAYVSQRLSRVEPAIRLAALANLNDDIAKVGIPEDQQAGAVTGREDLAFGLCDDREESETIDEEGIGGTNSCSNDNETVSLLIRKVNAMFKQESLYSFRLIAASEKAQQSSSSVGVIDEDAQIETADEFISGEYEFLSQSEQRFVILYRMRVALLRLEQREEKQSRAIDVNSLCQDSASDAKDSVQYGGEESLESTFADRMVFAALELIDVSDRSACSAVIGAILPILATLEPAMIQCDTSSNASILDSIANFLQRMLKQSHDGRTLIPQDYAKALSAMLGLSIARADFNEILRVVELLCSGSQLGATTMDFEPFINQLSLTQGPILHPGDEARIENAGSQPGDLYCWGRGENGRLGIKTTIKKKFPSRIEAFSPLSVKHVSVFANHVMAIDLDGKVFSWGKGDNGRLGHGTTAHCTVPKLIGSLKDVQIRHVCCGLSHSLIVSAAGAVYSLGDGGNGRLGHGNTQSFHSPELVRALSHTPIRHVVCGAYHSIAINDEKSVYAWGKNEAGQLGIGTTADSLSPVQVSFFNDNKVEQISCGWEHNLAIVDGGRLFSWGSGYENSRPVLGHGGMTLENRPRCIEFFHSRMIKIAKVAAGWDHAIAVTRKGSVFTWGEGLSGKLGHGDSMSQSLPKRVEGLRGVRIVAASGGADHSAAITEDGALWTWGGSSDFQLGTGAEDFSSIPVSIELQTKHRIPSIRDVLTGDKFTLVLTGVPSLPLESDGDDAKLEDVQSFGDSDASNGFKTTKLSFVPEQFINREISEHGRSIADVVLVVLSHLDRLSSEQRYSPNQRQNDAMKAPYCIDVSPDTFKSLQRLGNHFSSRLEEGANEQDDNCYQLFACVRLIKCNFRRLFISLGENPIDGLTTKYDFDSLHYFLRALANNRYWKKQEAVSRNFLISEIGEIMQIGLEVFYPTDEHKLQLALQIVKGDVHSAMNAASAAITLESQKLFGITILSRLADAALARELVKFADDSSQHVSLFQELIQETMSAICQKMRNRWDSLRHLHPLETCTIDPVGDEEMSMLQLLLGLEKQAFVVKSKTFFHLLWILLFKEANLHCGELVIQLLKHEPRQTLYLHQSALLKGSLFEKLLPVALIALRHAPVDILDSDLMQNVIHHLIDLLRSIDQLTMWLSPPAKKPTSQQDLRRLSHCEDAATLWLVTLEQLLSTTLCYMFSREMKKGTVSERCEKLLVTPLFRNGMLESAVSTTPLDSWVITVPDIHLFCLALAGDTVQSADNNCALLATRFISWLQDRSQHMKMHPQVQKIALISFASIVMHVPGLARGVITYSKLLSRLQGFSQDRHSKVELTSGTANHRRVPAEIQLAWSHAQQIALTYILARQKAGGGTVSYEEVSQSGVARGNVLLHVAPSFIGHATWKQLDDLETISDSDVENPIRLELSTAIGDEDELTRGGGALFHKKNKFWMAPPTSRAERKWRRLRIVWMCFVTWARKVNKDDFFESIAPIRHWLQQSSCSEQVSSEELVKAMNAREERVHGRIFTLQRLEALLSTVQHPAGKIELLRCVGICNSNDSTHMGIEGIPNALKNELANQTARLLKRTAQILVESELSLVQLACISAFAMRFNPCDANMLVDTGVFGALQSCMSISSTSTPIVQKCAWTVFRILATQLRSLPRSRALNHALDTLQYELMASIKRLELELSATKIGSALSSAKMLLRDSGIIIPGDEGYALAPPKARSSSTTAGAYALSVDILIQSTCQTSENPTISSSLAASKPTTPTVGSAPAIKPAAFSFDTDDLHVQGSNALTSFPSDPDVISMTSSFSQSTNPVWGSGGANRIQLSAESASTMSISAMAQMMTKNRYNGGMTLGSSSALSAMNSLHSFLSGGGLGNANQILSMASSPSVSNATVVSPFATASSASPSASEPSMPLHKHDWEILARVSRGETGTFHSPQIALRHRDRKIQVLVSTSAGEESIVSTESVPIGIWTRVCVSLQKRTLRLILKTASGEMHRSKKSLNGSPRDKRDNESIEFGALQSPLRCLVQGNNSSQAEYYDVRLAQLYWIANLHADMNVHKELMAAPFSIDTRLDSRICIGDFVSLYGYLGSMAALRLKANGLRSLLDLVVTSGGSPKVSIEQSIRILRLFRKVFRLMHPRTLDGICSAAMSREESTIAPGGIAIDTMLNIMGASFWIRDHASCTVSSDEHARSAIACEIVTLLRTLLGCSTWSSRITIAFKSILSKLHSVLELFMMNGDASSWESESDTIIWDLMRSISVLNVVGSHVPKLRIGARTLVRSKERLEHVIVSFDACKRSCLVATSAIPHDLLHVPVEDVYAVDEVESCLTPFKDVLIPIVSIVIQQCRNDIGRYVDGESISDGVASPSTSPRQLDQDDDPDINATKLNSPEIVRKLEIEVLRTHVSSCVFRMVIAGFQQNNGDVMVSAFERDDELLSNILYVASMPTRLDSWLGEEELEAEQQRLWKYMHTARQRWINGDVDDRTIDVDAHENKQDNNDDPYMNESVDLEDNQDMDVPDAEESQMDRMQKVKVDQMVSMGFDIEFCRIALISTGWNENAAVEWLLINMESLEQQRNAAAPPAASSLPKLIPSSNSVNGNRQRRSTMVERKQLSLLMAGLPLPEDGVSMPDLTQFTLTKSDSQADLFQEAFFKPLPPQSSSNRTNARTVDDMSIFNVDETYPYNELLVIAKGIDEALGIMYARTVLKRLMDRSPKLLTCTMVSAEDLVRFYRISVERSHPTKKLDPTKHLNVSTNLSSFVQTIARVESRDHPIILKLRDEALRHFEVASTPNFDSTKWFNRSLVLSDIEALSQPRIEFADWIITQLVSLNVDGVPLLTIRNLWSHTVLHRLFSCTMRSCSTLLKECLFRCLTGIIRQLTVKIPASTVRLSGSLTHKDSFPDVAMMELLKFVRRGLSTPLHVTVEAEQSRLCKSSYLSSLVGLTAALDSYAVMCRAAIRLQLEHALISRVEELRPVLVVRLEDIGMSHIQLSWEPDRTPGFAVATGFEVSIERVSSGNVINGEEVSNCDIVDVGQARASLHDKLLPLTRYSFSIRAYAVASHESNTAVPSSKVRLIHSAWSEKLVFQTLSDQRWDISSCRNSQKRGLSVHPSRFDLTATCDSSNDKWRTIRAIKGSNSGMSTCTLKLDKMSRGYIFLGIATKDASPDTYVGGDANGYGLFINDRSRYHARNKVKGGVRYGDQLKEGDRVSLVLDHQNGTLHIYQNGTDMGLAFDDIPKNPEWFPAVSLYHRGDSVSFIDIDNLRSDDASTLQSATSERLVRRFRLTWDLIHSSACMLNASDESMISVLELAYPYWREWSMKDVRLHGKRKVVVDVAFCQDLFNLLPGQRVQTGRGPASVWGVNLVDSCLLVLVDGDVEPTSFTAQQASQHNVRILTSPSVLAQSNFGSADAGAVCLTNGHDDESEEMKMSGENRRRSLKLDNSNDGVSVRAETRTEREEPTKRDAYEACSTAGVKASSLSFEDFCQAVISSRGIEWTRKADEIFVESINERSRKLNVSCLALSFSDIRSLAQNSQQLSIFSVLSCCARYVILRVINEFFVELLPYTQTDKNMYQLSQNGLSLVFTWIKRKRMEQILHRTSTFTRPADDPYEDPPDLKRTSLNRHKASQAGTVASPEARFHCTLFGQAFVQLSSLHPRELRRCHIRMLDDGQERTFMVKFEGEGVTDNGGPYRECFNEFIAEIFSSSEGQSPLLPLFIASPNARDGVGIDQDAFIPNPACRRLDIFHFFGKIIGCAVRNKILLDLHLPSLFWRWMIGQPLDRTDLESIDSSLVQRFRDVIDIRLDSVPVSDRDEVFATHFDLKFEGTLGDGSTRKELVEGGSRRPLKYSERFEWAQLYEKMRLFESADQLDAIRDGLYSIVPELAVKMYTAEELPTIICGTADFSVELLKSVTVYEGGDISADSQHIRYFWKVLEEFTPAEKTLFIKFVWARTRLPTRASFFSTRFKIQAPLEATLTNPDRHLPQSHTCFFSISLPAYSSSAILKEKLLYACENCQTMDRDIKLQDSELYNYETAEIV